jgi:hypothetical protein
MVAATFDRAPALDVPATTKAAQQRHWIARLLDALVAARMQQARREVARYSHIAPYALDEHINTVRAGTREMPSGGW